MISPGSPFSICHICHKKNIFMGGESLLIVADVKKTLHLL
jgi:hypothetical protein